MAAGRSFVRAIAGRGVSIPAFLLVKPVRTTCCTPLSTTGVPFRGSSIAIFWVLGITGILAAVADAQSPARNRESVRETERVARASWQPVRAASAPHLEPANSGNQVRVVQHQSGGDLPPPPRSVVEIPSPEPEYVDHLDGQIVLQPFRGGGVSWDGLSHGGSCGCESVGCDGGCDSFGGCDGRCGGDPGCDGLCSTHAWRPCVTICFPQNGWASFEYLAWWQDGMSLPPLVTSNMGTGIPGTDAGVLGRASTVTLFGGDRLLDDSFDGGRLRFGVWLDRCHTWGVGAEFFSLGTQSTGFRGTSTGNPILARPFFNTQTGLEDSELVAFPNVISGTIGVTAESQLDGWGVHFRRLRQTEQGCGSSLFCSTAEPFHSRTEMLFGYRGLQLDERVLITEDLVSADQDRFEMFDRFDTRNQFNGFDVGWAYQRTRGYWSFDGLVRLAFGNTRQTVTINGQTTLSDPINPPPQTLLGGLLAQESNIGTYQQDQFTVVPEINANIGFQLTDNLRMTFGYTFIYWSNIVRPGEHISRDLNPNQLPPPNDPLLGVARPEFKWDTVDYWVQGLNVGGEYRW